MISSKPIYTIEWLKREAKSIYSAWNGQDSTFIYEGDIYPAEQADTAKELLEKLEEVEALIKELSL